MKNHIFIFTVFLTFLLCCFSIKNQKEIEMPIKKQSFCFGIKNVSEIKTIKRIDVWDVYVVTAYCGCEKCCGKTDGITATGTVATEGRIIAVDPNIIPYWANVEIKGIGIFTAEDCGGAIKGKHIDIFFDSHQKAIEFGVQEKLVFIKKR